MSVRKRVEYTLGALYDSYGRTSTVVGIGTNAMSAGAFYASGLGAFLGQRIPWMNFPLFLLFSWLVYCALMLLAYKFLMPGSYRFANEQWYEQENKMKDDVQSIIQEQKEQRILLEKLISRGNDEPPR